MNWKELFVRYGNYSVGSSFYGMPAEYTVEEMYQAFKARMQHEKELELHHELCNLRHNNDPCNCVDYR